MLLFLKCHKVSLEVILENQEKNSSGCFAWSWKVSVPKKSVRENEGKKREVKRGETAVPLLWSLQCQFLQSQHCVWLPKKPLQWIFSRIYFGVCGCKREVICCRCGGSPAERAGGAPELLGAAVLRCLASSLGRGCCENSQCKGPCSWALLGAKCAAKNAKFSFSNAGENQAWELQCAGHCSAAAVWSELQKAEQPAVFLCEPLGPNGGVRRGWQRWG